MKYNSLTTTNEVYRKIKEISKRTMQPRPHIPVNGIANEMEQRREHILPMLVELKDLRLIKFNDATLSSVKLTLLGDTVNR